MINVDGEGWEEGRYLVKSIVGLSSEKNVYAEISLVFSLSKMALLEEGLQR